MSARFLILSAGGDLEMIVTGLSDNIAINQIAAAFARPVAV
jgi:hypothetical protein